MKAKDKGGRMKKSAWILIAIVMMLIVGMVAAPS